MSKHSTDPKPAGPIRRAVRTVARHTNVRAAERTRQRILAEELDQPPVDEPRAELARVAVPPTAPACLARLGALLGIAGVLAATAAAAFVGVLDARLDVVRPTSTPAAADPPVSATCAEPASWCGGASR
ncbi:hypothetical protein SAMN04489727_1693 [Amycolatopsis tolypomycina]|uniref:Uncharacterized protein n=1 Tax=Amycolatopsis tolypomycina TaxID=208445 RepID=A0A1H4JB53_9PSEU|nr:hypothetical protein [Amycolatopsis tolypomycina]SEB43216.1 hypothetical protein SAMN04489727_1693 [Amycolatopsis tolypomycina]